MFNPLVNIHSSLSQRIGKKDSRRVCVMVTVVLHRLLLLLFHFFCGTSPEFSNCFNATDSPFVSLLFASRLKYLHAEIQTSLLTSSSLYWWMWRLESWLTWFIFLFFFFWIYIFCWTAGTRILLFPRFESPEIKSYASCLLSIQTISFAAVWLWLLFA